MAPENYEDEELHSDSSLEEDTESEPEQPSNEQLSDPESDAEFTQRLRRCYSTWTSLESPCLNF
jgi:hypothetical protein